LITDCWKAYGQIAQHFVDPDTGVSNSKYQMSAEKYLRNYTSIYIIVNNHTFRPLPCKIHVKKKAFDTHEQLDDFFKWLKISHISVEIWYKFSALKIQKLYKKIFC